MGSSVVTVHALSVVNKAAQLAICVCGALIDAFC